jgi:hypothetical protein
MRACHLSRRDLRGWVKMRWRYGDLERGRWMNSWGRWLGRMLLSWWLSGDLDSKVLLCRILNRPGHGDGMSGRRDVNPISAYGIGVSGVVIPIVSSMQIGNIILPQTVSDLPCFSLLLQSQSIWDLALQLFSRSSSVSAQHRHSAAAGESCLVHELRWF